MKLVIAAALALTATAAQANHSHCGTTKTQYWETNYIRVIETRDCRGQLVNWERIDSTPSYGHRPHQPHHNTHSTHSNEALIIGVILGSILAQK